MAKIILPAACDRSAVRALVPEFVAALDHGRIEIDASKVEKAGQALLQLLVSARRTGPGARIDHSPALLEIARRSGLDAALFDEGQQ